MNLVITCGRKAIRLTGSLVLISALYAFGIQHAAAAEPQLEKAIQDGKTIFVHETFGGNGMTCDGCHLNGGVGSGKRQNGKLFPA